MNLLELAGTIGVEGFLHCVELEKLVELAANREVLEVGSYRGLSAWGMALTARRIVCVDTFKAATDGQRQTEDFTTLVAFQDAVARYRIVHALTLASEVAGPALGDQTFDMIFLDAMHDYDSVRNDIHRWWTKLRPRGILALHDYGHDAFPGVKQAADEIFGPAPEGTVLVTLRWIEKP